MQGRIAVGAAASLLVCCSLVTGATLQVAPPGYEPAPGGTGQTRPCDAGTAKKGAGNFKCLKCLGTGPSGGQRYQPYTGQSDCLDCQPGGQVNTARTFCTAGPGYMPGGIRRQPQACPVGHAKAGLGNFACLLCSGQRYQPRTGQSVCLTCPASGIVNRAHTTCTVLKSPPPLQSPPLSQPSPPPLDMPGVMISGSDYSGVTPTAELQLFSSPGIWNASIAQPSDYRDAGTLADLGNGKMLVAGGTVAQMSDPDAEVYDVHTDTWTPTGPMVKRRGDFTMLSLPGSQALACGGINFDNREYESTCEIYDLNTNSWTASTPMTTPRALHASVLVQGVPVHCGGDIIFGTPLQTCEKLDPTQEQYELLPTPETIYMRTYRRLAALASGTLIFTSATSDGGIVSVLKAGAANWTTTQTPIRAPTGFGLCTFNNSSTALLIGGIIGGIESAAVQQFDEATSTWNTDVPQLLQGRFDFQALALPGDKFRTGTPFSETLTSTERLYPGAASWASAGTLNTIRAQGEYGPLFAAVLS